MTHPGTTRLVKANTDTSDTGISAVLSQVNGCNETVVPYVAAQCFLNLKEIIVQNKIELLAVVVFLEHFRLYLLGKKFTIHMDHGVLTWLQIFKNQKDKWHKGSKNCTEEYNFSIVHHPGKQYSNVKDPVSIVRKTSTQGN